MGAVVTCRLLCGHRERDWKGRGWGELTIDDSIKSNDERRHRRRSSFGCHVALSDVAPANRHWLARADGKKLLSSMETYRTTTNDDDVVVRRLVATSLSATWHPQPAPHPSPSVVTWRWSILL